MLHVQMPFYMLLGSLAYSFPEVAQVIGLAVLCWAFRRQW